MAGGTGGLRPTRLTNVTVTRTPFSTSTPTARCSLPVGATRSGNRNALFTVGLLLAEETGMVRMRMGPPGHGFPLQTVWSSTNEAPGSLALDKIPVGFSIGPGTNSSLVEMKLKAGEALWGFGERFDALNMRGRTMESWIVDAWGGGNRSYIC